MRKTVVNLALIIAIFFTCAFFQFALMFRADRLERNEVITISDDFPIVVLTADEAQIVYSQQLEKFKQDNSDYSFLVPIEKYEFFLEQIKSNTRSHLSIDSYKSNLPWEANFTMQVITAKHQKFEVSATWDDDRENVSEYEATDKEIFPKYHKHYFGPGKVLVTFPFALLLTAGLWIVLGSAIWSWKRKKKIK